MSGEFLNVKTPDGFKFFDFEVKPLKAGLRAVGKEVAKESRKAVSKKAVSHPGEFPGMQSGQLKKAIKYKVSRSGRSVWVVATRPEEWKSYYPAFVVYGHRSPHTDSLDQSHKKRKGKKVAEPRKNYITEIAKNYGRFFEQQMEEAFNEAIKT